MRLMLLAVAISFTTACATGGMGLDTAYGAKGAADALRDLSATPQTSALLLFGGRDHDVFLGCLTCSEFDAASVHNQFGVHGSDYSATSVFNKYGQYGGEYSLLSPCNHYTSTAPVVVDREGAYYGELTVNEYNSRRTRIETLRTWITSVCSR